MAGITVREIKALKLTGPAAEKEGARAFEPDGTVDGLGVRYGAKGAKTFVLRGRVKGDDKTYRWTLGEFVERPYSDTFDPMAKTPHLTLEQARVKAKVFRDHARNGVDPKTLIEGRISDAARKRAINAANTFGAVVERYLKAKKLRPLPLRDYVRCLRGDDLAPLRDRPIAEITDLDIDDVLDAIQERTAKESGGKDGAGIAAVYSTYARLRGLFNWVEDEKSIPLPVNPMVKAVKRKKPANRKRVLEDEEIQIVYPCLDAAGLLAPAVKLLLLTGARLREICSLEVDEIHDLDEANPRIELPEARTKNGQPHKIPLSPMAVDLLKEAMANRKHKNSHYVFSGTGVTPASGYSKAKEKVDAAVAKAMANVDSVVARRIEKKGPWCWHDFRRSFRTGVSRRGIPPYVGEAAINHVSGVKNGVAAIYDHYNYEPEVRQAMNIWANHIATLLNPDQKTADVIPIHGKAS